MDEHNYHDLIPAHALGALDPDEAAAMEARLATDAALREEFLRYRALVEELPLAVAPVAPPPAVKAQLLARIAAPSEAAAAAPARRGRVVRLWAPLALAAALLVALVLGGMLAISERELAEAQASTAQVSRELDDARQEIEALRRQQQALGASLEDAQRETARLDEALRRSQQQAAALEAQVAAGDQLQRFLAAPDLATRELRASATAPQANGTMYMRPGDRNAVVFVSGLPTLTPGESYQFWLAEGPIQFNAGTLALDDDGTGRLLLRAPVEVNRFSNAMITVERVDRAARPSDITVLFGSL